MKAIISAHIKNVVDDPALSSYLTRMGMANVSGEFSEPYQAHNDQFAETVWSNLKQFVDSGEIIRLPKNLYFPLIIGSASFLCRTWLRNGQGKKELTSQTNVLVKTAWKSLQP